MWGFGSGKAAPEFSGAGPHASGFFVCQARASRCIMSILQGVADLAGRLRQWKTRYSAKDATAFCLLSAANCCKQSASGLKSLPARESLRAVGCTAREPRRVGRTIRFWRAKPPQFRPQCLCGDECTTRSRPAARSCQKPSRGIWRDARRFRCARNFLSRFFADRKSSAQHEAGMRG